MHGGTDVGGTCCPAFGCNGVEAILLDIDQSEPVPQRREAECRLPADPACRSCHDDVAYQSSAFPFVSGIVRYTTRPIAAATAQ